MIINHDKNKLKKNINIVKQYNISVRCIYINISKKQTLLQNN
jgi:hypothetical protein